MAQRQKSVEIDISKRRTNPDRTICNCCSCCNTSEEPHNTDRLLRRLSGRPEDKPAPVTEMASGLVHTTWPPPPSRSLESAKNNCTWKKQLRNRATLSSLEPRDFIPRLPFFSSPAGFTGVMKNVASVPEQASEAHLNSDGDFDRPAFCDSQARCHSVLINHRGDRTCQERASIFFSFFPSPFFLISWKWRSVIFFSFCGNSIIIARMLRDFDFWGTSVLQSCNNVRLKKTSGLLRETKCSNVRDSRKIRQIYNANALCLHDRA